MPAQKILLPASLLAALLLQGCVGAQQAPAGDAPSVTETEPAEIQLNMPQVPAAAAACDCDAAPDQDYTFLDKGLLALARGKYVEAHDHFARYRRMEQSRAARWEADIAHAFLLSVPDSPYFDATETRKTYRELAKDDWEAMEIHPQVLILRQSLEGFAALDRSNTDLRDNNRQLARELEKREEALKKLRELTLGQPGAAR